MAIQYLPGSGPISLSNIQTEFGGSNPISISEYYRGGSRVQSNSYSSGIPSSGSFSFNVFYNKAKVFQATITSNQADLNLYNYLVSLGWDGVGFAEVTINPGVWIYSNTTGAGGLNITSSFSSEGVTVHNYGYIIGKGGRGGDANDSRIPNRINAGGAGGPAVVNTAVNLILNNYSGAYIAGGGGGGAGGSGASGDRMGGGGGGAGGGDGGTGLNASRTVVYGGGGGGLGSAGADSPLSDNNTGGVGGQAGGSGAGTNANDGGDNDSASGGGGGGRVLPGNGVNARVPTGFGADYPGGHGGAALQKGGNSGYLYWTSPNYQAGSDPCVYTGTYSSGTGAGGGGWAAAGGNSSSASGGAAGRAVTSGVSYTLNNSGTIYGAVI